MEYVRRKDCACALEDEINFGSREGLLFNKRDKADKGQKSLQRLEFRRDFTEER